MRLMSFKPNLFHIRLKVSYKLIIYNVLILLINVATSANNYKVGSIRSFSEIPIEEINDCFGSNMIEVAESLSESELAMDAIKDEIIKQNRFVNRLDSASFFALPVGLSYGTDTLANPDYCIIIDQATIYPQYAEFSAFMSIKNPIDNKVIRFRADKIKFSFKSGLINGFKLKLVSEVQTKLGESSFLYWKPGCFVDWDCAGFKSLGINASVELNEKKYVKVDVNSGKAEGKVKTDFFISTSSLNDIVLELSFEPFKVMGFDEAYFSFKKLTLDCSDTRNSPGFSLPSGYPGGYTGDMATLWRGFYVEEALVVLDKKFKQKDGVSTSFYAKDLILDDFGLTGDMGVENLLSYDKGKLGSWAMSVTHFELSFFTGDFKKLELNGGVKVDGLDDPMIYEALYDADGNYHFGINPGEDLDFNVFAAKVSLDATSRIDVWVEQGKFMPAATLTGDITFACAQKSGGSDKLLQIPYIEFQEMRIATKAPEFDIKYVALATDDGESDFNNFPIVIKDVNYLKKGDDLGRFGFNLFINLIPAGELGITGGTEVGILADLSKGNWKYKGVEVGAISVTAKLAGAFDINGTISFVEGDPTYGKGFRGDVDATFAKTFEMKTVVVFGKVNGFRYFFADAFLTKNPGIAAGPFWVNGFGGGVFYKMRQAVTDGEGSEFGASLSGINYVPDKNVFLGLKVGLKGSFASQGLIDASLNFGITFTTSFGVAQITFDGEATMLKPPAGISKAAMKARAALASRGELPKEEPTSMKLRVAMVMDFQRDVFHSEMELFLNVGGVLKGVGSNNRAGWGVIHVDPDKWYLHIGTPTDPIGVNFVGLMEVNSYFMAGHDIPDAMMMNQRVLEILDMDQSEFNGERKDGELVTGKGLAFGAHFKFDTGDLTFLIFYARFELGGGFDIMLLDYGPNTFCKGRDGTLGINGWYAKGQAYAYFAGKIGIKVKVFRKTRKFEILNIQAAAAIRMEGPNPTWMIGVVGGRYRLLGGMIKGSCKFKAEIGEKCELRTMQDLSDLEIIADLTPTNDSEDVDIFAMPQGVFNMPVEKVLTISEDPKLTKVFKIKLEEYQLYEEDGTKYPGVLEWNADKTSLAYRMDEILYSNTKYKIVAKVSFEEKVDGEWQVYKDDDGKKYIESKEAEFKTGELPDKMPNSVIEYSYPLDRMVNFYKQEYNTAYVGFNMGVSAFFERTEGYKQQVRWTKVNGDSRYTDIKYLKESKRAETTVPADLINNQIYHFELVHVPTGNLSIDSNISQDSTQVEGTETQIVTRSAEGAINDGEEKAFLSMAFRCSKYNKFLDKVKLNEMKVRFLYNVSPAIDFLGVTIYHDEIFDYYETISEGIFKGLIQREAILADSKWYLENIDNLIYKDYPKYGVGKIVNRNVNELGVPPVLGIDIWQVERDYLLTEENIQNGTFNNPSTKSHLIYTFPKIWANDYIDIRSRLSSYVDSKNIRDSHVDKMINTYPWPQIDKGVYPVKVSYVLPGINKVSSYRIVNIINDFDVNQINFKANE